jgi:hypothetical protein
MKQLATLDSDTSSSNAKKVAKTAGLNRPFSPMSSYVDGRKYLLEISGTESAEHLASRHGEKVRQLQANPFGKDGYVFVCCFSNQKAKLSFHQFESA